MTTKEVDKKSEQESFNHVANILIARRQNREPYEYGPFVRCGRGLYFKSDWINPKKPTAIRFNRLTAEGLIRIVFVMTTPTDEQDLSKPEVQRELERSMHLISKNAKVYLAHPEKWSESIGGFSLSDYPKFKRKPPEIIDWTPPCPEQHPEIRQRTPLSEAISLLN